MEQEFKTIIEPFRIKMIEPIRMTTRSARENLLKKAFYNIFLLHSEDIIIDFLTDSGTSAMSAKQWARMMEGDESYAGCSSFYRFEKAVKELTQLQYVYPTHQGRAAERILFSVLGGEGKYIPNNTHFDTTRANIEFTKAEAIDLVIAEGKVPSSLHPFKGNIDLIKLQHFIQEKGPENIPVCFLTVTNNSGGGQPVSMENIRETKKICDHFKIPLFLDACRFAENAYFIKLREKGYENKTVKEIAQEMFSYVDGATMSAKKDALVNMGGFLALNCQKLSEQIQNIEILTEGFPTYGGLSGRDLEAIAQGLQEVVDEDYLQYRIRSTQYLGDALIKEGIPVVRPIGGHAVYIDAKAMLEHIPPHQFPGQALVCELYLAGGIRAVEIGSLMFGKSDPQTLADMELVRLAIPRRVYTQSHVDYVVEVIQKVNQYKNQIKGLKIVQEPPYLRHFSAKLDLF